MRIGIIGAGLIGGSIALAARQRLEAEVLAYDLDPQASEQALRRDAGAPVATVADVARGAEAIFVAVPVGCLQEMVGAALEAAPPGCVVTDVGSTKRAVVAAHRDERFVGGHPLAGAESAGIAHARADLFEGATWYLTPTAGTSGILYERLHRLLQGFGARPAAIDPETHDTILATVSHLPHVLANVLVSQAARALAAGEERLPATGPSFRDATRVAGAPSAIWTDIYLSNRDSLAGAIDRTVAALQAVKDALGAADQGWVREWNDAAAADRRRLLETELAGGPLFELRVSVPNRPGVVAQVALELGRAGVNIADLALYPAPDMSEGVIALWVRGEQEAGRVSDLIGTLGFPVVRG